MMATTIDEYHGRGGSYLIDPKTGKRKPVVQEAAPASSTPNSEVTSDAAPDTQAPDSGKD